MSRLALNAQTGRGRSLRGLGLPGWQLRVRLGVPRSDVRGAAA